jgi:hemerythrin-like domain-containing protein
MSNHRAAKGNYKMARRTLAIAIGACALKSTAWPQAIQSAHSDDEGVTAPEDLMKEHGVLDRCLLVYEELIRRLKNKKSVPPQVLYQTAELVQHFVEEYHERNEETYIFPLFVNAKKKTTLVETLLAQHKAGRQLTTQILQFSRPESFGDPANQLKIVDSCEKFIRMYRPHKAREDTVLFPALRTLLPPEKVESLGDDMEKDETKVLGNQGFEKSVVAVEAIEKQLGIDDLSSFTPILVAH